MHEHGILVVPDFIANAGGIICAAVEYRSGTQRPAFEYIDERIRANVRAVWKRAGPTRHFRALQPLRWPNAPGAHRDEDATLALILRKSSHEPT